MKKVKRILLLTLCMLLCLATPVLADEKIQFGGEGSRTGNNLTVTLSVDKGGAYSGKFELQYDITKVELADVKLGDALADTTTNSIDTDTAKGIITVGFADTKEIKAGEMIVAEFSVLDGVTDEEFVFPYVVTEWSNDGLNGLLGKADGTLGNVTYPKKDDTEKPADTEEPTEEPTETEEPSDTEKPADTETPADTDKGSDANGSGSTTGTVTTVTRNAEESTYSDANGVGIRQYKLGTVTVNGKMEVLPTGAELKISEVTSGDTYKQVQEVVDAKLTGVSNYKVFDIALYDAKNVKVTQLSDYVEVTMPVPAGLNVSEGTTIAVYRLGDNNTLIYCEATVKDGMITFKTDSFGTFVLAEQTISAVNQVKTSDTNMVTVAIFVLLLGMVVAAYAVRKARK